MGWRRRFGCNEAETEAEAEAGAELRLCGVRVQCGAS